MPCQIKIKQLLVEKVKDMSDHGLDKTIKYAKQVEKEVNSFFNSNVVYFTQEADFIGREITISDSLVKTYYDNELSLEQKADLQRKETGNYDVVDGEIVVSTNNGFNNEYSLNDFQEEQKELDKIVENINNTEFDENGQGLLFGNLQDLAKSNRIAVGEIKVENKKITGFNKKPNPYLRDYNTDLTEVQAKKLFEKTNKSTKDYEGLAVYFANMFVNEIIDKDVHLKMGYMRLAEYSQQKPKILITDTNKKINPFYQYNNTIIVGIYQLQQLLENGNYSDYQKFQNLIQSVAQEESIHLFAEYLLSKETVDNIYSEMSEKDIQKIKDIYENENLDKNGIVHEYVRMVVQQHVFNSTTEQEKVKLTNSVLDFISKMINEIQQFLSEIIGQNNTQKTIEDVINFTKGNFSEELDAKIKNKIFEQGVILEASLKREQTNNIEENETSTSETKEGIDFVFEQNPELEQIGTKEQYSNYLDTIFPESKVNNIVYHGTTNNEFINFKETNIKFLEKLGIKINKGTFFSDKLDHAKYFSNPETSWKSKEGRVISVLINLKKPLDPLFDYSFFPSSKNDGILSENINDVGFKITQYAVFHPSQIHILGSKQDIEGFKEFVNNNNQKTEDYFSNEINKIQEESKIIENSLKEYETSKKIDNKNTTKAIKNREEKIKETNNKLLSLGFESINENEYQFSTSSYITFKSKLNSLEGIDVSINTFKSPDYLIKIKIAPLKNNFDLQKQGELPFNPIELKLALKENDFIQDIADNTFEGLTEEQIKILKDNLENGELNLNCKI